MSVKEKLGMIFGVVCVLAAIFGPIAAVAHRQRKLDRICFPTIFIIHYEANGAHYVVCTGSSEPTTIKVTDW